VLDEPEAPARVPRTSGSLAGTRDRDEQCIIERRIGDSGGEGRTAAPQKDDSLRMLARGGGRAEHMELVQEIGREVDNGTHIDIGAYATVLGDVIRNQEGNEMSHATMTDNKLVAL